MELFIRSLNSNQDYKSCVALQKETWGENFNECVPPALLMIAQKLSGVAAGAFDKNNRMLGFVFGLTGLKDGELVNWSHMLAVKAEVRGLNIGKQLKLYQRELLLKQNIKKVFWTYEPLVARNAHLNLNKLGARIVEYVAEMYVDDTGSDLHGGIGMDRFIVEWALEDNRVKEIISGKFTSPQNIYENYPVANTEVKEKNEPAPLEKPLPETPAVRIEIPHNLEAIQNASLELAATWRAVTRKAFLWYFDKGFSVAAFYRNPETNRCFYVLTNSEKTV